MFSLIIVIVSIALVAVLALATIYYGGSTTQEAQARARASTVINQGQQLLAASEIFYNTNRRWPTNMEELVSTNHLKTIPSPPGELGAWTQPVSGQPTYTVSVPVDESLCRAVNKQARGDDGILTQAYRTLVTQCYGTNASSLTVVVTKNAAALDATVPAGDIGSGTVPTDPADAGWLVPPGAAPTPSGSAPSGLRLASPWPVSVSASPYGPVALGWNSSPGLPMTATVGSTTTQTVTITNIATDPVAYGVSWLSTSNSPALSLSNNSCGGFVSPGSSCSVDVTYAPTAVQTGAAHLVISPAFTNTNGGVITAPLPNESVSVTVRYSATSATPPVASFIRFQLNAQYVPAQGGNPEGYQMTLTHAGGAPLSELNPASASDPTARDTISVMFTDAWYQYVYAAQPEQGVNISSFFVGSMPSAAAFTAGSQIPFTLDQTYGVGITAQGYLLSTGQQNQSWCVTLPRVDTNKFEDFSVSQPSGPC